MLEGETVDEVVGTEIEVLGFVYGPYGLEVVYRSDDGALMTMVSWAVRMLPNTEPVPA